MKREKVPKLLAIILMLLPMFLGALFTGNGSSQAAESKTVDVTIHKRAWNIDTEGVTRPKNQQNTGSIMKDFGGTKLAGATFVVYDVTEKYQEYVLGDLTTLPFATGMTSEEAIKKIQEDATGKIVSAYGTKVGEKTTEGTEGTATFEKLAKKSGGVDAVYLFIETQAPSNVTEMAAPMVLPMPAYEMEEDGGFTDEELSHVHLYPKNIQRRNQKRLIKEGEPAVEIDEETAYVNFGDRADYGIWVNIPKDLQNKTKFEVRDIPDKGLAFDENRSVYMMNLSEDVDYQLSLEDDGGFTIIFNLNSEKVLDLAGTILNIWYSMRISPDTADKALENKAIIDFGSGPDTVVSEKVAMLGHKFKKLNAHTNTPLSGAKFRIYMTDGEVKLYLILMDDGLNFDGTEDEKEATIFISDANGVIKLLGLAPLTNFEHLNYVIEEIAPPEGFIITEKETHFSVNVGDYSDPEKFTTIYNTPKGLLPATGGNGILAFLAIGLGLMLGAFVWYKREKQTND
ncbi:SpaH/EbpB family LPXTG-anchored major pilin [Enterococcus songbeiensis]|uniref:SpaH/EbpB family LPXTG-anchored major pilin n=1 Tax=Enterococcus songbeiensis TaxID=2559927 RepID=UPI001484D8B0|nr:SpaH/EbpB family LPXTG-anchored major pilin [Enterococcus songbeiensis]